MSELEILERKIMLKYQLLSLINEEIAEMEAKKREMQEEAEMGDDENKSGL